MKTKTLKQILGVAALGYALNFGTHEYLANFNERKLAWINNRLELARQEFNHSLDEDLSKYNNSDNYHFYLEGKWQRVSDSLKWETSLTKAKKHYETKIEKHRKLAYTILFE